MNNRFPIWRWFLRGLKTVDKSVDALVKGITYPFYWIGRAIEDRIGGITGKMIGRTFYHAGAYGLIVGCCYILPLIIGMLFGESPPWSFAHRFHDGALLGAFLGAFIGFLSAFVD